MVTAAGLEGFDELHLSHFLCGDDGSFLEANLFTWGIHSKHAHALRRPDPIIVGLSKWELFCACSVWTASSPLLWPQRPIGVFYVTPNKILLSSTHIRSATHVPHAHTFTAISRLALLQTTPFGAVRCGVDLCVPKSVPGLTYVPTVLASHCYHTWRMTERHKTFEVPFI